jgi:glycosyl transferase family 2
MSAGAAFLSVVLPCRNQADHISQVIARYFEPLDTLGRPYEIVAVPNASTDATLEVVAALAAREGRVRMVENPRGGWGLSVLTGLRAARGEVLCYANSSRTDPTHLPALLDLYLRKQPCVAKVRRAQRGAPLREAGSWLYNLEARILFGLRARDVNGTPKMLSRSFFEGSALGSTGDLLDLELLAKAHRMGLPIVDFVVTGFKRHGGRSTTGLLSAWGMYAGAVRLRREVAQWTPA